MVDNVPAGWKLVKLQYLIALNPKTSMVTNETEVGFVPMTLLGTRWADFPKFERRKWISVKKGYTHFQDGDLMLAKITPCFENGKVGLARGLPNGIGSGSTEYFVCRASVDLLDTRYLLAYLKTEDFLSKGTMSMTGSVGHKRVPKEFLLERKIPLAPLREQARIANQLDTLLTRIQACNDRFDAIPALLKRFRQTVYIAATSGALTADWRLKSAGDWTHERAADICAKVQSGGTPKAGFSSQGVPFLKVYNIVNQKVAFDYKPQYIEPSIHNSSMAKSKIQPGDVLMNIVGPPLGKVAIVPNEHQNWNINQAITLFRPSDRISTGWLYCILCSGVNIADIIHETRGSAGQTNISLSQCRDFIFPVPQIAEQREIILRVEKLLRFADNVQAKCKVASIAAQRMTPLVLAKAFRGELVAQDPSDEPASALLERLTSKAVISDTPTKVRQTRRIGSRAIAGKP
jgi:type I restriction enzyme, S subunit